ncbi:hypothetical protein Slin15195_G051740 [Septoria linicola]|uniref:Uncharacterized protein n=1 Tax=Septoria linicola TaxID=215465 RepID=A0A9Q9EIB5_9PEZI|nr:hypothetical protein Slin14017_G127240 [Septoria linicola]USW51855.1 hypothetical protein Slin15195_G051740 [Septoria linicola]
MAKSTPQPSEAAATPASSTSTITNTPRITKRGSEGSRGRRATRQRTRMLAEASSSGALTDLGELRFYSGKGKGRLVESGYEDEDMVEDVSSWEDVEPEVCPIIDKDTKPFPIMELPTEIRLEIYRACLTRPYNILLSKREQPPPVKEDGEVNSNGSGTAFQLSSDEDERGANVSSNQIIAPRRTLSGIRSVSTRSTRPSRPASSMATSASSNFTSGTSTASGSMNANPLFRSAGTSRSGRRVAVDSRKYSAQPEPERKQQQDPLITNVLRASKEIYKEARSVLYSENHFVLDLNTAMQTLGHLHQRSRRQIKHVELEIPTYNEILERFQETVRLSLRYCSGLKKFIIHMPFTLPGADGSGTTGNTTVYANGFDILRWLPQECDIIMEGNICSEIELVVNKHLHLAKTLDKLAYARRQLISNETSSSSAT